MTRTCTIPAALVAAVLFSGGCSPGSRPAGPGADDGTAGGRKSVFAVNYPLAYFARRIGGERIEVVFPVPPDVDPAFWNPDDAVVQRFQQADLVLLNGARYGRWTARASLPAAKVVDTSRVFSDQYIVTDEGVVHSHGPSGEHSHKGIASTTWLDPRLAIRQAAEVHAALAKLLPDQTEPLAAAYDSLRADLEELDRSLGEAVAGGENEPLLASHPVYQYLARRCNWNMKSVHWEPDQLPGDQEWQKLESLLAAHPARWMIWEAPPLEATAERLAARGIGCVVFYPCGNAPESDYLQVMRENVERLQVMRSRAEPPAE